MRSILGAVLAVLVWFGAASDSRAQSPVADVGARGTSAAAAPAGSVVATDDEVPVIVRVSLPADEEQRGARGDDPQRIAAIASRQNAVIARARQRGPRAPRNVKAYRHLPYVAMQVDRAAVAQLAADPEVAGVWEDRLLGLLLYDTPTITNATGAWASGMRGAGQVVAVIDTGVDARHPFLSGKVIDEACFSHPARYGRSLCPSGSATQYGAGAGAPCTSSASGCWHGTHVAGIAAGRLGVLSSTTAAGMAPDASLMAIQVFQEVCDPSCHLSAFDSDIIAGLDYVYSRKDAMSIASVNLSLGGGTTGSPCDGDSPPFYDAVQLLRSANIATVAAAGNDGNPSLLDFPACLSNVVSVGATTKAGAVASYSNNAASLSLLAPGSSIYSSYPGGGFATASGTSMATPHVAGAWALIKGARPQSSVSSILQALQATGSTITDSRTGRANPQIRIAEAVSALGNVPPTVALTAPSSGSVYVAPATFTLSAVASDADGAVTRVEFYANGALVGQATALPYVLAWSGVPAGSYALVAVAYDDRGASTASPAATVTVNAAAAGRSNVALAANGGVAYASSTYSAAYPVAAVNDGDHRGSGWGNGGGWNDASWGAYPDWVAVALNGAKTIDEVDVYTLQDNFSAAVEPDASTTFTRYGITDFDVQYWNGSSWVTIAGGAVRGNNLVWRRITFPAVTTTQVRVLVLGALANYSRVVEIEAYTASGTAAGAINVAAQGNGAVASASSTYSAAYPVAAVNDGERRGYGWGSGGGWNDASWGAYPDWVAVALNGAKTIDEVDVYTLQDNFASPVEPDASTSFTRYGITDFDVQYWNGSSWVTIAGGAVRGNNLVWRRVVFSAVTTSAVRVLVLGALANYSRVVEIEAWSPSP